MLPCERELMQQGMVLDPTQPHSEQLCVYLPICWKQRRQTCSHSTWQHHCPSCWGWHSPLTCLAWSNLTCSSLWWGWCFGVHRRTRPPFAATSFELPCQAVGRPGKWAPPPQCLSSSTHPHCRSIHTISLTSSRCASSDPIHIQVHGKVISNS